MRTKPEAMRVLLLALMAAGPAAACDSVAFEGVGYTVCTAQKSEDVRLFLNGPNGAYGGFSALDDALSAQGMKLAFAMNAGMYQPDLSPVGLYVEDGQQHAPIITRDGPGNFGLLPNGVFCIGARFSVTESRAFAKAKPPCRYASQSGPMLVLHGVEHPAFRPTSMSFHIRNGVGVSADGATAYFAISDQPVNFDSFARFFRDQLHTPDALYFDGSISRLYAPDLGRPGEGFSIGPIVGVVVPKGTN